MTLFDTVFNLQRGGIHGGHLVAWSDSCAGQNKNFYTICLWQLLVQKGLFSIIDHKFPEPGHSFLDSDRDFAHVEQSVRKHENIYTVDEYRDIMHSCVRKSFVTMEDKFREIKKLPEVMKLKNNTLNTDGERVRFRDGIRWIRVDSYGEYNYRESTGDKEPWKTLVLNGSTVTHSINIDLESLLKPPMKRPINVKKLKDI